MSKLVHILFLALIGETLFAQSPVLTFTQKDTVYLRWQPSGESNLEGYNIYRRESGAADWTKINTSLIKRLVTVAEINTALGYQSDLYFGMFKTGNTPQDITDNLYTQAFADETSRSFIGAISLVNYKFGYAMGVIYKDPVSDQKSFEYKITTVVNGQENDWATSKSVKAGIVEEVPKVDDVKGKPTNESAELSWHKDVALMKKGDLITYNVYRGQTAIGPFQKVNYQGILPVKVQSGKNVTNEDRQSFTDKYLNNGQSYFYQVMGVNAFGFESANSNTIEIVPVDNTIPLAPTNINIKLFGNGAKIGWSGEDGLKGFEIFKGEKFEGPFEKVYPKSDLLLNQNKSWIDLDVEPGGIYYYYLNAVAMDGKTKSVSDTVYFVYEDLSPPKAPENVKALAEKGKITITWNKSKEKKVIGYEVERATDKAFKTRFSLNNKLLEDTVYVDKPPATSQTTYGFVVYAVSINGIRSEASKMVKARMPDKVPPQAPFITYVKQEDNEVKLKWTRNIEADFGKYKLYRKVENGTAFELVKELSENSYMDNPPKDGKYFYQVTALDSTGNESLPSPSLSTSFERDDRPQPSPEGIAAVENGKIKVKWNPAPPESTNGYLVKKKDVAANKMMVLKELNADELSVIDKYSSSKKQYEYHIITIDKRWRQSEPLILKYEPESKAEPEEDQKKKK